MSLEVRVFLGFVLNKELKLQLNQSSEWKGAKIGRETALIEAQWQGKEYIGVYLSNCLTFIELKEKGNGVRNELQSYCPKLNFEHRSPSLFSQVFVS